MAIPIDMRKFIETRSVLNRLGVIGCNCPHVVVPLRVCWAKDSMLSVHDATLPRQNERKVTEDQWAGRSERTMHLATVSSPSWSDARHGCRNWKEQPVVESQHQPLADTRPAPPSLDLPYYGIGFVDSVKRGFKKYATFTGRASLSE